MDHDYIVKFIFSCFINSFSCFFASFSFLSYYFIYFFQCFTMDEKRSKAVIEAFNRLYKEGLIYRHVIC